MRCSFKYHIPWNIVENETKSYGIELECWGTCNHDDCDEVLPMDMVAIAVNSSNVFCSPSCTRDFLDSTTEDIEFVILHDPQLQIDREYIGLDKSTVDLVRPVSDLEDARMAVTDCENLYGHEFRVEI